MTMDLYFDYLGILLKAPEASGKTIVLNWVITEPKLEEYVLSLENSALTYMGPGRQSGSADATLKMTRETLDAINTEGLKWKDAISSGRVESNGDASKFFDLRTCWRRNLT
jgi:alkyl sulfatase BDS1-like metallo-beta-lactamase superfamily hydrolase